MKSSLFGVFAIMLLFASPILGQTCSNESDDLGNGQCCCWSGYSGADCSTPILASCLSNAPAPTNFSTPAQPSLTSVTYNNDQLTMVVGSDVVNGRHCSSLTLGIGSSNAACSAFVKSTSDADCNDVWTGVVDWNTAIHDCGFTEDNSSMSDFILYNDYLQVVTIDAIAGSGSRTETSVFPITVQFPSHLEASVQNIQVSADFSLVAILASQQYAPSSNQATLVFQTSVPWPYYLTNPAIVIPATFDDTTDTFVETTQAGSCPQSTAGTACVQTWRLVEAPVTNTCMLNGQYNVSALPACRSGSVSTNDCPYLGDETVPTILIVADILSESFCATASVQIVTFPSLVPVLALGSQETKTTFMQNHPAFFEFSVYSPQAAVQALVLKSVSVDNTVGDIYTTLNGGAGITATGTQLNFLMANVVVNSSIMPFQFEVLSSVFQVNTLYTVSASVDIIFAQNAKRSVILRSTNYNIKSSSQQTAFSIEEDTTTSTTGSDNVSSAFSIVASSAFTLSCLVVLASML